MIDTCTCIVVNRRCTYRRVYALSLCHRGSVGPIWLRERNDAESQFFPAMSKALAEYGLSLYRR